MTAWVEPRTWKVGEYPNAARFNQLSDTLAAIGDPWTAYTPEWYAFDGAPSIGNGAIVGYYARAGTTCAMRIVAFAGSTTTQGIGGQGFTLPFVSDKTGPHHFHVVLASTAGAFVGLGAADSGDWGVFPWVPTSSANCGTVRLSSTSPNIGTTGWVVIEGIYECIDEVAEAPASPTVARQTFTATASRAYTESGSDTGSAHIYTGQARSSRGNRRSACWFDSAAITAWVAGRTITKVELGFYPVAVFATPSKLELGWHTDGTVRSTYGAITGKSAQQQEAISPPEDVRTWVDLGGTLSLWDGTNKGVIFGPGVDDSDTYQLQLNGATESNPPQLRITVA